MLQLELSVSDQETQALRDQHQGEDDDLQREIERIGSQLCKAVDDLNKTIRQFAPDF
jgi:hypothetical protein